MSPAAACSASGVNAPGGVEADDAWVPEGADGEDVAEDVAAAVVVGCDVPHAVLMPATAAATHTGGWPNTSTCVESSGRPSDHA